MIKYFPNLTEEQLNQFNQLQHLYNFWNKQVNLISRTDIDNLYLHHVLHSLVLGKVCEFTPGTRILDIGTGGGFPGIPLAILFPEVLFTLIDSIGKKIDIVHTIALDLGLINVKTAHVRAEEVSGQFDFVVSRAVTKIETLLRWSTTLIHNVTRNDLPNGLLLLKGGRLESELDHIDEAYYQIPIANLLSEAYFKDKYVLYFPS